MTDKFTSKQVLAMADMLDEVRIESQPRRDMQSDKIAAMLRSLLSERTAAVGADLRQVLIDSLVASKGWLHGYAEAYVDTALQAAKPAASLVALPGPFSIDHTHPNRAHVTFGFDSVYECKVFIKAIQRGDVYAAPTTPTEGGENG